MAETISSVRVVERASGVASTLPASACVFAYRNSVFKTTARGRYVVTAVDFDLACGAPPNVRYPELARHLEAELGGSPPTLADVRRAVLSLRRRKSMVMNPEDANRRSAGSFFTNPIVAQHVLEGIRAKVGADAVPAFDAGVGHVKLSAGWLIEQAGFARGTQLGRVGTSSAHALALVNRGGATARELAELALRIRDGVRAHFGVRLVSEPNWIGFTTAELSAWRA